VNAGSIRPFTIQCWLASDDRRIDIQSPEKKVMALKIECPKCNTPKILQDEERGNRVRCESCGQILQVAAPDTPVVTAIEELAVTDSPRLVRSSRPSNIDADDDTPEPRSRRDGARRSRRRDSEFQDIAKKSKLPWILAAMAATAILVVAGSVILYFSLSGGAKFDEAKDQQAKEGEKDDAPGPDAVQAPVALDIKPLKLAADQEERKLPENIADVAVGGGGRYLVLHMPRIRKLALFDVSEGKVVDYFPAADDNVFFAAGMRKLIVVLGTANVIQRWDLQTRQREVTAPNPINGVVRSITMGSASNGPLLVCADGANHGRPPLGFVDPATLKVLPLQPQLGNGGFIGQIHLRASADGQVFGGWSTNQSPSGVHSMIVQGNQVRSYYEHDTRDHVVPSPDGRFLYTGGGIFTSDIKRTGNGGQQQQNGQFFFGETTIPSVHGDYYLRAQMDKDRFRHDQPIEFRFSVHMAGDSRPLVNAPNLDLALGQEARFMQNNLSLDKRVLFVPDAKVIVTIPSSNNRLVLHHFDVDEALEKSDVDYLFVTSRPPSQMEPGKWINYQIKAKSKKGGLSYRLDSGPQGMKLTADGRLTWKVPEGAAGEETVIVTVKDKAGQEIFHTFKLSPPQRLAQMDNNKQNPFDLNDDLFMKQKFEQDMRFQDKFIVPPPPFIDNFPPIFEQKKEPVKLVLENWRLPPLPGRWALKPAKLDQDKVVRALPDSVHDVVAGGGGRFLILSLPNTRQVAIFDANEGRIVKYLGVGSNTFKVAAGMTKLMVALTDSKILQRWDLRTFTRELTVPLPVDSGVHAMAMGHASEGPLLIQDGGSRVFLDIQTMKKMSSGRGDPQFGAFDMGQGGGVTARASGDGRVFVVGGQILHLSATGYTVHGGPGFPHQQLMFGTPGPDGKHIFGMGAIHNSDGKKIAGPENDPHGVVFVPAYSNPFYLKIPHGNFHPQIQQDKRFDPVSIHCLGDNRPLVTLKEINGVFRAIFGGPADKLPIDQQYHFIPDAELIVTIPGPGDKLELHRFNVTDALEKSGIDYLFVSSTPTAYAVPGKEYRYALDVKSKKGDVQINLESGPKDMKSADKTVTWKVPADFAEKETDVILTVKDKAGQEIFHLFKIHIVKELPGGGDAQVIEPAPKAVDKKVPEPDFNVDVPAAAVGELDIKAPKLDKETVTLNLPDSADDMVVGGGGRFLLISIPKVRKVALFDVNEAKIVHYFPVSGDGVRIAAGMDKLIMVFPDTKIIQRWNLLTRERELTTTIDQGNVKSVLLGSASHGPLALNGSDPIGGGGGVGAFYDLKTLKKMEVKRQGGHGGIGGEARVSADGTVFGIWGINFSPSGLQSLILTGNELRGYYEHTSVGHIVPGPDGKILFTGGGLYTNETRPLGAGPRGGLNNFTLPAVHGNYYFTLSFGDDVRFNRKDKGKDIGLTIHIVGDTRPLATVPIDVGKFERFGGNAGLPLDKRIHFIPAAKMIVTLTTNDNIVVRHFDVEEAMNKAGMDYLFVASRPPLQAPRGKDFIYPLAVKSKKGGLQFTVESGPDGLKINKAGVVLWKVPADAPVAEHDVLLTIRDMDGQENFHTFKVRVVEAAAPERK
jgi:ribosomal protein S27E